MMKRHAPLAMLVLMSVSAFAQQQGTQVNAATQLKGVLPADNGGYAPNLYKGAWVSGTTYTKSQIVTSNGHDWSSLVDGNVGNVPATGSAYWTLANGAQTSSGTVQAPTCSGATCTLSNGAQFTFTFTPSGSDRVTATLYGDGTYQVRLNGLPQTSPTDYVSGSSASAGTQQSRLNLGEQVQGTLPYGDLPAIPTQRGKNAVTDLGLVPDGVTDNAAALTAALNNVVINANGVIGTNEIFVPCGNYYFLTGVTAVPSGLTIIGEGSSGQPAGGCVNFISDQNIVILNLSDPTGNNNQNGPHISHIAFKDTSSNHNQVIAGLQLGNYANVQIDDLNFDQISGNEYATGSAAATTGSPTVTISGGTLTAAMANPAIMLLDNRPYQIKSIAGNVVTLFQNYQGTNTGPAYAIVYGGVGLWLASANGYDQYGPITNIKSQSTRVTILGASGPTSSSGGSRFDITGFANCAGYALPDTFGMFLGTYQDTHGVHISENNCSFGVVAFNAHQLDISGGRYETTGGGTLGQSRYPLGTSCPAQIAAAGAPQLSCSESVLIESDTLTTSYGNRVENNYFIREGVGVELTPLDWRSIVLGNTYRASNQTLIDNGTQTQFTDDGRSSITVPFTLAGPNFAGTGGTVTSQAGLSIPTTGTAATGQVTIPCGIQTQNGPGSTYVNVYGTQGGTTYECVNVGSGVYQWVAQDQANGPGMFNTLNVLGNATFGGTSNFNGFLHVTPGFSAEFDGNVSMFTQLDLKALGTASSATTYYQTIPVGYAYNWWNGTTAQGGLCTVNLYGDSTSSIPTYVAYHPCTSNGTSLPVRFELTDFDSVVLPSFQRLTASTPVAISPISGGLTFVTSSGVTSAYCVSGFTCTNLGGKLVVNGGSFTTGTVLTLTWNTALPRAAFCQISQEGGSSWLGLGTTPGTTTGQPITSAVSVSGTTFNFSYSCNYN